MVEEMTPLERYETTLKLEEPDTVPTHMYSGFLMKRYLDPEPTPKEFSTDPEILAKSMIKFHEETGMDCLYTLSDMGMLAEAYGVTMKYPKDKDTPPQLDDFQIKNPEDWEDLEVLDPKKDGRMHVYDEAARICRESEYGGKVPIIVEIPSPITTSTHICAMDDVMVHMKTDPDAVKKGLETLAKTTIAWIKDASDCGADYVNYLLTRMTREVHTEEEYREFGTPYDEKCFEATKDIKKVTHACGCEPMLDLFAEYNEKYPDSVLGVNFWDRGSNIDLRTAKKKYGDQFTLLAGIDHTDVMMSGTPKDVKAEIKDAMDAAKAGGGFILAPGCDPSPKTPKKNIAAFMEAAREYGKY